MIRLLGLPLIESTDYKGKEIAVVGSTPRGVEIRRFIDFNCHEGRPIVVLQSLIHKYVSSGMITKSIHCGSIEELEKEIEEDFESGYPIRTASISTLDDLI